MGLARRTPNAIKPRRSSYRYLDVLFRFVRYWWIFLFAVVALFVLAGESLLMAWERHALANTRFDHWPTRIVLLAALVSGMCFGVVAAQCLDRIIKKSAAHRRLPRVVRFFLSRNDSRGETLFALILGVLYAALTQVIANCTPEAFCGSVALSFVCLRMVLWDRAIPSP